MTPAQFNYVVGTQTIGPAYRFTKEDALVETARATQAMGSNLLKISVSADFAEKYSGLPANPALRLPRDIVEKEPSFRRVLDMPFAHVLLWVYGPAQTRWTDSLTPDDSTAEYRALYDLTRCLLTRYNRTGKRFLLGHWEGDWHLHPGYDYGKTPTPAAIRGMIDWLNIRQKAIDDAKRDTAHSNVSVYHYTEVNLVQKARKGGTTLTSAVLPNTHVDFVSYSSYDSLQGEGTALRDSLQDALDYIETKLPAKTGIDGKRVFIGEYGFPARQFDPQAQRQRSRDVIQAALEWGCPYILYWELYNNEVKDGQQVGFWLIDDKNRKLPVYNLHRDFLHRARAWVADFERRNKRLPTVTEYRRQALQVLQAV